MARQNKIHEDDTHRINTVNPNQPKAFHSSTIEFHVLEKNGVDWTYKTQHTNEKKICCFDRMIL